MFRRQILAAVAAIALVLSIVMSPALAAGVSANAPAALASEQDASAVTDQITTFVKRVNSTKDDVRHRAWTMMTENGQKSLFYPGEEQYFIPVKTKLLQPVGDVMINPNGGFDVEVILSGLWTAHGLYHGTLTFNADYQIDNFTAMDPVAPEGKTSSTITVTTQDGTISVDQESIVQTDVVLLQVTSAAAGFQTVELDHLGSGQSVDNLASLITDGKQDKYAFTGVAPGGTKLLGIVGLKPGTYVVSIVKMETTASITASVVITVMAPDKK